MKFPIVTTLLIAANFIVFFIELAYGAPFIERWSLKPAQVVTGHQWGTIITAMFMHAGWLHILGNMIFLWAFGPDIEDTMGRFRYFAFYIIGGIAAFIAQIAMNPHSDVPNLGASGAIAAVMGAFLVTFPRDRIRTLLFLFIFITIAFIPAALLVAVWFVLELFSEVGALVHKQSAGIAYMAHIGGIIYGAIFGRIFEIGGHAPPPTPPPPRPYDGF